jgi:hypothetical protein
VEEATRSSGTGYFSANVTVVGPSTLMDETESQM